MLTGNTGTDPRRGKRDSGRPGNSFTCGGRHDSSFSIFHAQILKKLTAIGDVREGAWFVFGRVHSGNRKSAGTVSVRAGCGIDALPADGNVFAMKVTYYVEILSSWCHWVEPVWNELKIRYAGRAEFEWKIALMNPGDFPASEAQCEWFYRRSGGTVMHSLYQLNSGWFEAERKGRYDVPNLVAEAGKDFGFAGDEIRLALADAALRQGVKIGDLATAVKVAAKAGKIDAKKLRAAAESKAVKARVDASTAEFFSHQLSQRPSFILTDAIGDKAVFSGLVRLEPLVATIDAMLADTAAYAAHKAHHGSPPSA